MHESGSGHYVTTPGSFKLSSKAICEAFRRREGGEGAEVGNAQNPPPFEMPKLEILLSRASGGYVCTLVRRSLSHAMKLGFSNLLAF